LKSLFFPPEISWSLAVSLFVRDFSVPSRAAEGCIEETLSPGGIFQCFVSGQWRPATRTLSASPPTAITESSTPVARSLSLCVYIYQIM
jgi:hypothetical protein